MARIKGPNGLVNEIEDVVARSLVGAGNRGYSYVEEPEPAKSAETEGKPPPKRRGRPPASAKQ